MEKILIIANWKMNPATLEEARHLFEVIGKVIPNQGLDKIFKLVIFKVVNPTALLRLLLNDGSFLLA